MTTLASLTPSQLAAVYNHHAETPVKRIENRAIGTRRVAALLAKIEVDPADAIASVIPPTMTPLPDDPDWTPADVGYGDKIEDDERQATHAWTAPTDEATAKADADNDETFRQVAEDAARQVAAQHEEAEADAIFASVTTKQPRLTTRAKLTARRASAEATDPTLPQPAAKRARMAKASPAAPEPTPVVRPAVEAQARWLGFTSMATRNSDRLDFKDVSIASLLQALETAYLAGYDAGHAATATKRTPKAGGNAGSGKARAVIIEACCRKAGATSKELFDATGWKFASWSHQIKIAAKATGRMPEIRKVDGTTRYFLVGKA
jgi:hypothetical protein